MEVLSNLSVYFWLAFQLLTENGRERKKGDLLMVQVDFCSHIMKRLQDFSMGQMQFTQELYWWQGWIVRWRYNWFTFSMIVVEYLFCIHSYAESIIDFKFSTFLLNCFMELFTIYCCKFSFCDVISVACQIDPNLVN